MIRQQLNFAEVTHTHTHTLKSHTPAHMHAPDVTVSELGVVKLLVRPGSRQYMLICCIVRFFLRQKIILWYVAGTGNHAHHCEILLPRMVLVCWTKC